MGSCRSRSRVAVDSSRLASIEEDVARMRVALQHLSTVRNTDVVWTRESIREVGERLAPCLDVSGIVLSCVVCGHMHLTRLVPGECNERVSTCYACGPVSALPPEAMTVLLVSYLVPVGERPAMSTIEEYRSYIAEEEHRRQLVLSYARSRVFGTFVTHVPCCLCATLRADGASSTVLHGEHRCPPLARLIRTYGETLVRPSSGAQSPGRCGKCFGITGTGRAEYDDVATNPHLSERARDQIIWYMCLLCPRCCVSMAEEGELEETFESLLRNLMQRI